ncbi:MAG: HAMP domain-containing sensor histidine kinase [Eubacteriales bacterium]|nr:HAMP domain-containing sensor histidine kinase [Eubacteriales bacterium]
MIYIFAAVIAVVSAAYWFAGQFIFGGALLTCYVAAVTAICVVYFMLERTKTRRLIQRVSDLFDGKFISVADESELSGLERRVIRSMKNAAAREAKVTESYRNIAALASDISHQCKTPLSSLMMYAEMPPDTENSAVIRAQAEKLSFLLDALTKLSRCEGGLIAENLRPAENSVLTLICNAVNGIISVANIKHIEITSDIPDGLCAVFDPRWTSEAIFNLLDNAVKYSPPGSVISISARAYDKFARVDIADCGPGISENEQTSIWKRFYRGKDAADSVEGVGIGLYLTQLILISGGGRASVKSAVGQGSMFSVFLPQI